MSKVLVDRELLEKVCNSKVDRIGNAGFWSALEELSGALAQPAEAEGVEVVGFLYKNNGQALTAADMDADTFALMARSDFDGEVEKLVRQSDHLAALSARTAALSAERTRADVAVADANDAERELAAVTADRDRLRDAAGKAIAWLDAEQNGSGVVINRRIKLCRDAENSLRAAMAAKEA